ncbi:MAG: hypothetical protein LBG64_03555, partial [Pseudomonadales bacterium]|nr:hypothetical protein [Pseudomonadales bacterium]
MKKKNCINAINSKNKKLLVVLCLAFLLTFLSLIYTTTTSAQSVFSHSIDRTTTLRAWVEVDDSDTEPPTKPGATRPSGECPQESGCEPNNANHSGFCDRILTFRWRASTDNRGVSFYNFRVVNTNTNQTVLDRDVSGAFEDSNVRFWREGDYYNLTIKNRLDWGSYQWRVIAFDAAGNRAESDTLSFRLVEDRCVAYCLAMPIANFNITSPSDTINTLNPAIIFDLDPASTPMNFDVTINGTTTFTAIPAQTISLGNSTVNVANNTVTFQPRQNYLEFDGTDRDFTIGVVLRDSVCEIAKSVNTTYIPNEQCPVEAPIITPISPYPGSVIDQMCPSFTFSVCGLPECLRNITLWLNNTPVLNNVPLTPGTHNGYTVSFNTAFTANCDGPTTIITVDSPANCEMTFNSRTDLNDCNTWQIGAVNTNGLTTITSQWCSRLYRYYWCIGLDRCSNGGDRTT